MEYLSLCLICKDENDYLPEWLDYHILMGVEHFYVYDNESKISLRDSLKDYIERGWVTVVDISGRAKQLFAYDHCLQSFGAQTFWLGFIDTDEFLVPKTTLDLKELLKDYEAFGGLAVSSMFFGSNGHKTRPSDGQIAAYTRRTHATYKDNELVKCIVQPRLTEFPTSPHDFTYKENAWCVNEGFLRVDYQRFPNYTQKIQLNHYFCRSEREIKLKLSRGRGAMNAAWPRKRFDSVNSMSAYEDKCILNNLELVFNKEDIHPEILVDKSHHVNLPEKMTFLVPSRPSVPLISTYRHEAQVFRVEFVTWYEIISQLENARTQRNFTQVSQLLIRMTQIQPMYTSLYKDLAITLLSLNEPDAAWKALTQAWQLAPNTYSVLVGMAYYFLQINNYLIAEKTCRLLLSIAPHNLQALGLLTGSLIGQERFKEALKVGVPVVELSAQVGELPDGMGVFLVKKMADYLLSQKDYTGAARLWQAGAQCQPGNVSVLLELSQALWKNGDLSAARLQLAVAQELAPQNEAVQVLIKQLGISLPKKQKHS